MIKDSNPKELFEYVRSADVSEVKSLNEIISGYDFNSVSIEEILSSIKINSPETLLIDARSEKEFEESAIPDALNFPVLTNIERHNVGLIYKKYSQTSALWLAIQYAEPKSESLKEFLKANNAYEKKTYIYCWRGGGRSKYLSKMAADLGRKPAVLKGGYKSFRQSVNNYFSQSKFGEGLLELSGLTGCGKTELLRSVTGILPVIDLELSARHFSSLLGHIPFEIRNYSPVSNQSAFENSVYSQIFFGKNVNHSETKYVIESESRRIGPFEMPGILFEKLQSSPSVKITCSIDGRIKRIVNDYFGEDLKGIKPMLKIMNDKENFFRQRLSNKSFDYLIMLLNEQRVSEFCEIMIKEYYDKKYLDKAKTHIIEISTDDIASAKDELINVYNRLL